MARNKFQKGHPRYGGRKKGSTSAPLADIKAAAQVHGPECIAELWKIVQKKSASDDTRIKAMNILLERGYGRPAQDISVTVKRDVHDYTDADLEILAGGEGENQLTYSPGSEESGSPTSDQVH